MAFAAVTAMTSCSDKKVTKETFIGKWELKSFQHQAVNSTEWVEELSESDPPDFGGLNSLFSITF